MIWENFDSDLGDALDPHGLGYLDSAGGMVEHNVLGRTDGNGLITNGTAAPTVRNNIFHENGQPSATPRGRGICWLSSPAPKVFHNLFYQNRINALLWPAAGGDVTGTAANAFSPGDLVYGNLDADPRFVDPGNLDLHLQEGSAAIDAGDPNSPADPDGTVADIGPFFHPNQVGVGGEPRIGPTLAVFPNPFRGVAQVSVEMTAAGPARVAVFDTAGRRVGLLFEGLAPAGALRVCWDGSDTEGGARRRRESISCVWRRPETRSPDARCSSPSREVSGRRAPRLESRGGAGNPCPRRQFARPASSP